MGLKLLGLSGSLRAASTNTLLIREAARLFDPAEFTLADLRLPLYDGDLEAEGIPEKVRELDAQIHAADAVILATPEYNKMMSGVLKNALDWISRTKTGPWDGKPVAIMSAAAGRSGGERCQTSLRWAMQPFNPRIIQAPEVMIAASGSAFDENGQLTNERSVAGLQKLMDALRELAQA